MVRWGGIEFNAESDRGVPRTSRGGWAPSFLLAALVPLTALVQGCESVDGSSGRPGDAGWFIDITESAGLDFVHDSGAEGEFRMPEIMASGAALFDYDGDEDLDIYLTNGGRVPGVEPPDATPNRLYAQQPDGSFLDVTVESGLGDTGYGMGLAIGDIDNDGDSDVFVTNYGRDCLFRNRGNGTFENVTGTSGVEVDGWSTSAVFCDYDRDGYLDLFVTRYLEYDPRRRCPDLAGRPEYCDPDVFTPAADVLLRNRGDGTFVDVTGASGLGKAAPGLGVVCEDLDQDGWPDIYVANDGAANQCWMNQGDGTFVDRALLLGLAYNANGRAEAGMGVLSADLDGDEQLDLFLTHLANQSNTLYRRLGSSGYEDATGISGMAAGSLPYTGFGAAAFDVDLDEDLDLLVANGRVTRGAAAAGNTQEPWGHYAEPNLLYVNSGQGQFELAAAAAGEFGRPREISRGLAAGDIDFDGDVDVLVSNVEAGVRLYRNDAPRRGDWLAVRAIDPRLNRDAIGATVTLAHGSSRQMRTVSRGYSYLSSSDPTVYFGLHRPNSGLQLEVTWPDGLRERFPISEPNQRLIVRRGSGAGST